MPVFSAQRCHKLKIDHQSIGGAESGSLTGIIVRDLKCVSLLGLMIKNGCEVHVFCRFAVHSDQAELS